MGTLGPSADADLKERKRIGKLFVFWVTVVVGLVWLAALLPATWL